MYQVKTVTEKEFDDFLALPKRINSKQTLMQKPAEELALLKGEHTLSKYFTFTAFICYRDTKTVSRCAVTIYHDSGEAYLGFFESINNDAAAKAVMDAADSFAKQKGIKKLTGPVDASFWLSYRMKSNCFDEPRDFGEPYGLPYYPDLWKKNGYTIAETYVSTVYKKLSTKDNDDEKYLKRYNFLRKKGYRIVSAEKSQWDRQLHEVYHLLIDLYSDFPVFSFITEDDFCEMYKDLRSILDFSMVKLAYKNGRLLGFMISIPDYSNKLNGKIGLPQILSILKNRHFCKRFVILYVGVDRKHLGLGSALVQCEFKQLCKRGAVAIGALIKKGKVTERYLDNIILYKKEYVLFEKTL